MNIFKDRLLINKISEFFQTNAYYLKENYHEWKNYPQGPCDWLQNYETFKKEYSPCFVLSTGRCGTKLLTRILSMDKNTCLYHSGFLVPNPLLKLYQNKAYHTPDEEKLADIFEAARGELIYRSYRTKRHYIETNPRITFFAHGLKRLFPNAKFINLVRNPAKLTISFMRRQAYQGRDLEDIGRIKSHTEDWSELKPFEKIGWFWNETQKFSEEFKQKYPASIITIKSEDLFQTIATTRTIFDFLALKWPGDNRIKKLIAKPINKQISGHYPQYQDWPEEDQNSFKKVVPLSEKYNYIL